MDERIERGSSTELARHLSDAALAYRASRDDVALAHLESLVREAAAHVSRVGEGTVDHIVLSSILKLIIADVPSLGQLLQQLGWRWLP
jgi:hypothetical protein